MKDMKKKIRVPELLELNGERVLVIGFMSILFCSSAKAWLIIFFPKHI